MMTIAVVFGVSVEIILFFHMRENINEATD